MMWYQKVLNNIEYAFQAKLANSRYGKIFYEDRVNISEETKKTIDFLKTIGLLSVIEHSFLSIKLHDLKRY